MFCKQCGKQLDPGSPFCRHCGAPADAAPAYGYAGQQGGAGNYPAPKKKKTGLIVAAAVIVVLVAALTVAVVLLLKRPGGGDTFAAVDNIVIDLDDVAPAQADDGGDDSQPDTPDEPDGYASENPVTPVSEEPAAGHSSPDAQQYPSQQPGQQTQQPDASDYATTERPDLGDFVWYVESVYFDGLPAGRTPVTGFSELTGGWKAYIWYDPDNVVDANGWDFLNIYVDGSASDASITLDWYLMGMADTGSTLDVSFLADTVLYGDYSHSMLSAGDPGYTIDITDFYYYNGKQYGVGYMTVESGEETYVALVRP